MTRRLAGALRGAGAVLLLLGLFTGGLGLATARAQAPAQAPAPSTAAPPAVWPIPGKPFRIIVAFGAGGGSDIATRHLQPLLAEVLGVPVIVENKGGSGGMVGTEAMVRSPPDGHTIGMVVSAHASNPALHKVMPFDAVKDWKPITILFRAANVWGAHPSSPYKSIAEVLAAAKANPGKVLVATSGNGTAQHLGLEQLKIAAGVDIVHVPYRSAGGAFQDLVSGQIDLGILNASSMLAYIKDGRLKPIAVTSEKRSVYAPDIPAIAETLPGFDSVEWFAYGAPGGTPDDVVEKIYAAIVKAARTLAFEQRAKDMGVDLVLNTPADLAKIIAADLAKFKDLVEKAKITAE